MIACDVWLCIPHDDSITAVSVAFCSDRPSAWCKDHWIHWRALKSAFSVEIQLKDILHRLQQVQLLKNCCDVDLVCLARFLSKWNDSGSIYMVAMTKAAYILRKGASALPFLSPFIIGYTGLFFMKGKKIMSSHTSLWQQDMWHMIQAAAERESSHEWVSESMGIWTKVFTMKPDVTLQFCGLSVQTGVR